MRAEIFANDGGPLIIMDADRLPAWDGGEAQHARACGAAYPAGVLAIPGGLAVVIGSQEGIATARWHRTSAGQAYVVGCVFADDGAESDLERMLNESIGTMWSRLAESCVTFGKLLLFHAACPGAELDVDPLGDYAAIGDALSTSLVPGRYEVAACEVSVAERALYNVVRWSLLAGAS